MDIYSGPEMAVGDAFIPAKSKSGRDVRVPVVGLVTASGDPVEFGTAETVMLITNGVSAGAKAVHGGDYLARAIATNWQGASVKIQFLDLDKTTWSDMVNPDGSAVAAFTANRTQPLVAPSNATLRAVVTGGAPTGLYVAVSLVPAS